MKEELSKNTCIIKIITKNDSKKINFLSGTDYNIILDVDANSAASLTIKNKEGDLKTYPLNVMNI